MTTQGLLERAREAKRPEHCRIKLAKWMPALLELRSKDFTLDAMYDFLRDAGETVHKDRNVFRGSVSKMFKRHNARVMEASK